MHIPVLLQEVVEGLEAKAGEVILDATVGGGGHSEALCRSIGAEAPVQVSGQTTFICLDADEDAIERSRSRLVPLSGDSGCRFLFETVNYRHLDATLDRLSIGGINRAIFDLGLSSFQLYASEGARGRGFSFQQDEPLEMTFSKDVEKGTVTAAIILNEWGQDTIETLLASYGEEKKARQIAEKIVSLRAKKPLRSTRELVAIIESVVKRRGKIHPATKTFQALRMAVNDEFEALKEGLSKAWERLLPEGRIAVISFHSIEDRTTKDFFKELARRGEGRLITKKPIVPGAREREENPRSRSAKLRIIEKH
ncbi:MAG: 16S rRNA (cytosine(1402)-N(4))-methyltransferase [Candidatus Taylorbacteria bacterium RIFCSPHIGHO2_01_FULL_51_15]|uniref:Ribosomal RNA small subunit methyltransferase H n=1 Tax=Candidatus Taylorbacteria bacterium RIFCSPHIGHO2_01_FULL_51_15 TaxID=1802304 RepID=A0A1G2M8I4_9BACT|nr:MAG: 16S rRNA (cytosine(1402)-N(4))-methyltransferase [Candidatus Taylorbacteria bacterium RIFCSPHIGHO2_01_FULL_51_15]